MTPRPEVPGRPVWARDEPIAVQRLIVEYKLTALTLRALREFATAMFDGEAEPVRKLAHSVARALRARGLGELTGRFTPGTMTRAHPTTSFRLNAKGSELARQTIVTDRCPFDCHDREDGVIELQANSEYLVEARWDRQPKPPRAKNPNYHPAEWDG